MLLVFLRHVGAAHVSATLSGRRGEAGKENVMTKGREPADMAVQQRIRDFVDRYMIWMNEVAAAAARDSKLAASLIDLMRARLADDLDKFVEIELRLRAFERRVPEQPSLFKRVGNDG
jgi:hypothetical protein